MEGIPNSYDNFCQPDPFEFIINLQGLHHIQAALIVRRVPSSSLLFQQPLFQRGLNIFF
jgi:hypothetical protein